MAFQKNSKTIELSGSELSAQCQNHEGEYLQSSIDLDKYIANIDGQLRWSPEGGFMANSRNITLVDGVTLGAQCKRGDEDDWGDSQINLGEKIINLNGHLNYKVDKFVLNVDKENEKEASEFISKFYEEHKATVETEVCDNGDYKLLYISAGAGSNAETLLVQLSADASASVMHLPSKYGGLQTASFDVLQAKVGAWYAVGLGVGICLSANLIDLKASAFDLTLGVGVDSKIGVHDDSVQVQLLGTGVTLGRKTGISVLGSSFGVDFGRCTVQ